MKYVFPKVLLAALVAALPLSASATVLFHENFQEYDLGAITGGTTWTLRGATFDAVADTNNYFPGGGSQYASLGLSAERGATDPILSSRAEAFSGSSQTGQVSLTFYDPSAIDTSGRGFILRLGNAGGNNGTAFAIAIRNGEFLASSWQGVIGSVFGTYNQNTANTLDIVFNNSVAALEYAGGSVNSRSMDIYLNGVLVGKNIISSDVAEQGLAVGTAISHLNFTAKTFSQAFDGTIFIDEIMVRSDIAIPEPKTSAMILLGVATAVVLLTRKRRIK